MSTLVLAGTSEAYVAQGRWVARCGWALRCSAAVDLAPGQPGFVCHNCGSSTEVAWPPAAMVEGITRLLLMRPNPNNQNWEPGETLPDLLAENVLYDVMAPYDWTGVPLVVSDGRIERDELPVLNPRRELVASWLPAALPAGVR